MHFAPGPGLAAPPPANQEYAFRVPPPARIPTRIPVQDWQRHTRRGTRPADFHRTLPDGTPLGLTSGGLDLWERITGSTWEINSFHNASMLLWCATLTTQQILDYWTPAPPENTIDPDDPTAADTALLPVFRPDARLREAILWRETVIPAGAHQEVILIAIALWAHEHANLLEIDEATLDDETQGQKKSPAAALTGSSAPSTPSAAETPPAGPPSSPVPTPISSAPTEHGSPPTASPSSPPPPAAAETSALTTSSPSADQPCPYCIPGVDNCPHAGPAVWLAELSHPIGNTRSYAAAFDITPGESFVPVTTDIHRAITFPIAAECLAWIHRQTTPGYWMPTSIQL